MRPNRLTERLRAGQTAVCGWVSIDSPYLAESLSYAGYHAVNIDLQHGMFGLDRAISLIQAVSAGPAVPLARCPSHDPATIGKLLDAGAYGIICPAVDTPEQAAAFVQACRYPPIGARSYGPSRGLLYGGPDYTDHADDTILTWAMIESRTALDNLDAILATPGLDGVYVGPNDLALSLDETPGLRVPPPRTLDALGRIATAAAGAGVFAGVFCADGTMARHFAALGYGLVTPGNDAGIIKQAVTERITQALSDDTEPAGLGSAEGGGY